MKEKETDTVAMERPGYRCTLCHSTDVKMKMWDNPNTPEKSFEISQDEDDLKNCRCNRCQIRVALELTEKAVALRKLPRYVYRCSECGSTNVEMRQWVRPNEDDKLGGNDCPDRDDCWCNDCQEHNRIDVTEA